MHTCLRSHKDQSGSFSLLEGTEDRVSSSRLGEQPSTPSTCTFGYTVTTSAACRASATGSANRIGPFLSWGV